MSLQPIELTRARLEARIEDLIALLDLVDGDCDLEEGGDLEPSIGSPGRWIGNRVEDDLEFETDDYELSADDTDISCGRLNGGSGL
ncbi:hypothetical protein [uncultured Agrobacterium sp.]|uniref:hypothetical protein n=1 Tax=uncultured Agrobacterium sp. TaxID=157277 RepID=UPI002582E56D|nr:hypothetical protein [uncultured Agrobacterium sp.]